MKAPRREAFREEEMLDPLARRALGAGIVRLLEGEGRLLATGGPESD
jgi:hypothetical protein